MKSVSYLVYRVKRNCSLRVFYVRLMNKAFNCPNPYRPSQFHQQPSESHNHFYDHHLSSLSFDRPIKVNHCDLESKDNSTRHNLTFPQYQADSQALHFDTSLLSFSSPHPSQNTLPGSESFVVATINGFPLIKIRFPTLVGIILTFSALASIHPCFPSFTILLIAPETTTLAPFFSLPTSKSPEASTSLSAKVMPSRSLQLRVGLSLDVISSLIVAIRNRLLCIVSVNAFLKKGSLRWGVLLSVINEGTIIKSGKC
jgi:hypothetical protein